MTAGGRLGHLAPAISLPHRVRFRTEGAINRNEILEAASMKLAEAVLLLVKAGEQHLATSAGQLAEIVEFRASAASLGHHIELTDRNQI